MLQARANTNREKVAEETLGATNMPEIRKAMHTRGLG